jgi:hypothetical protein
MTVGAKKTAGLSAAASDAAKTFDDFAADRQRAHEGMHKVRTTGAAAGLKVEGDTILEPGPAPPPAAKDHRGRQPAQFHGPREFFHHGAWVVFRSSPY